MNYVRPPTVFIGYDPREEEAFQVCIASIIRNSGVHAPPQIVALDQKMLRAQGLYWRPQDVRPVYELVDGLPGEKQIGIQYRDLIDGRPMSTQFTYTRFLVPFLCQYRGRAIFVDCDFKFRENIRHALEADLNGAAVGVVKHDHKPKETVKMDGIDQSPYPRKNWSSFIVWDCGHPENQRLDLQAVNSWEGRKLHRFGWLNDSDIEGLDPRWNWLEKYDQPIENPAAVHWTIGGPWFEEYKDAAYADEYRSYLEEKPNA
jgi:hypothetical protein